MHNVGYTGQCFEQPQATEGENIPRRIGITRDEGISGRKPGLSEGHDHLRGNHGS